MIQPPSGRNTRQISSSPKTRATTVPPSPQRSQPPPNSKVSHRWKFSPKGMNRQNDDDDLPDVDVGETVGSLRFKLVASHRPPLPRTILESSIRGRLSLPRPRLFFASSPLSFSSLVHSLNFTNPPSLFIPPPFPRVKRFVILRIQGRDSGGQVRRVGLGIFLILFGKYVIVLIGWKSL